jgi:hypothetical protein
MPTAPASNLYEEKLLDFKIVLNGSKGNLEAIGSLTGPAIFNWNKQELSAWRDAGGLLEFNALNFALGGAKLEGNGSLTLDNDLRLLGSVGFQTRRNLTEQHFARLNRLLEANKIKNYQITEAALRLPLGLTFQNGQLAIGNQTLRKIGPVVN